MNVDLKPAIVRILKPDGTTVGTGFLVTDDGLIATCAHVVQGAGAGPGDTVRVAFHATAEEREAQVEPAWWRVPDAEDVAILRLERPLPAGVTPLPLGSSASVEGHALTTFGFPAPKPVEGMAGKCEVVGRTTERGFPVLQLRSSEITPGFSGAPVLDTVTRRVAGMVTAITVPDQYGRLSETAFITPTETLQAVCPELQLSDLCPYQGLAAFTEDHAEFFLGREKLVADLVDHLRGNPRFLAVVGPSGSGKSSVVRAGLFPALRRGEVSGSADWHLLTFRLGADPFAALNAAGLATFFQENDLQTYRPADLQTYNLQTAIRAFLEAHPQIKRLVLFADQFEELFTLCPQPVQEQFLRQLAALLESNLSVTLVLTLRADFYGHLLRYRPLVDWLKIGQVNVPPMGSEELRAAVEEPALRLGLRFDPGLVETIGEEAGEADHPLPLLESALTQLWERREDGTLTHAAYQAVGQVAGAIGQWAEEAYTELVPEERPLARRVFTRLVRYGEGEVADTRQRQSLSELVARPEEQEPLHRLVRRLADARLLVTGGDPGAETVEIIHDALLQQWGRLKHWTAEQREFYLWRQRLDERLQEWEEKGRDEGALLRGALLAEAERWLTEHPDDLNPHERKYIQESVALREQDRAAQERRRRRITVAAVGAAAIFSILAAVAGLLWRRSEEQRKIAVARQLTAQSQAVSDSTGTGLVRSALLAVESLRRLPSLEGDQALRWGLGLLPHPVARMAHEGPVEVVIFSSDGQWLASGSDDGTARVWEAVTGEEVGRMVHGESVRSLAFSPDGQWLASGSDDGTARVWEAVTGREVSWVVHEGPVLAVAFSPDGEWVASGGGHMVRVWEVATGREVARMEHEDNVMAMTFSPDGRWVASGSWDNTMRVWEAATGQEVARMVHEDVVWAVAFSPDGQWLASGGLEGIVRIWQIATGREVTRMEQGGPVAVVAFSPDGHWVISGEGDPSGCPCTVQVWEADTGREVTEAKHSGWVESTDFSPDGQWVVSAAIDGTVRVWEAATGREVARMEHRGGAYSATFSPDGRWLATGGWDGTVWVWKVATVARMEHDDWVRAVAFGPNSRWVVSGSLDGTARVWEATTGWEVARMVHEGPVLAVVFSPDGRWVASGSGNGTVRVWEATSGRKVAEMEHEGDVVAVAFSPNGQWVVSGSSDHTAKVWEAATGREVARMEHEDWVQAVAFSPDGRWVASGSRDNTMRVWEATTGQEVARMVHAGSVLAVDFSPDGQWVVSGSLDGTARVWEAATGREVARMEHEGHVTAVIFSSDGRRMVSGSWDGTILIWKATTKQDVIQMGRGTSVHSLAFSADGQWVVSAESVPRVGSPGVVRVWEVATGQEVARMTHEGPVSAMAFSPDGRWVVTASEDHTAQVWLWRPEDLIAEACARLPRNLTREEWQQYIGDEPYRPTCPNLPVPEE